MRARVTLAVMLAAAAVAGTLALPGSASAQMGVYVGPGYEGYYYYGEPGYPRVYRSAPNYYNDDDSDDVMYGYAPALPYPRGGCGVYHYWDGLRCVDARRK
jgi:hypothetical protein